MVARVVYFNVAHVHGYVLGWTRNTGSAVETSTGTVADIVGAGAVTTPGAPGADTVTTTGSADTECIA